MADSKVKIEAGAGAPKDNKDGDKKAKGYNFSKGAKASIPTNKFEGKVDALKGFYYDCSDVKQSDMFVKTTKEIAGYVGRTYKFGGDTRIAVESLEMPKFAVPDDPPDDAGKGIIRLWEKKLDALSKRQDQLEHNLRQLFALVWGQCTDVLQQKLEADEGFATMSAENDGLLLIKTIKNITYRYQSQKYIPHSLFESKKRFYTQYQGAKLSTADYYTQFLNSIAVIRHSGGNIWNDEGVETMILAEMKKENKDGMTDIEKKTIADDVEERSMAVAFILGSDRLRFGKLVEDMENSYLQGNNKYPTTVVGAHHLLANWKQDPRHGLREVSGGEINFVNADGEKRKGKVKSKKEVECHRCKQMGHYANECDNERVTDDKPTIAEPKMGKTQTGTTLLTLDNFLDDQDGYVHFQFLNSTVCMDINPDAIEEQLGAAGVNMPTTGSGGNGRNDYWDNEGDFIDCITGENEDEFAHYQFLNVDSEDTHGVALQLGRDGRLPHDWILLDNQSTVDVFCNKNLLTNIREHSNVMDIHCNAGVTSTNMIGELLGYGTVWYNPKGIANILSLARVKEHGYRVTFDSSEGNAFHLHKNDGTVRVFKQSPKGLYYMDTKDTKDNHDEIIMVNTVEDNSTKYSQRDYSKAKMARKIQHIIGRPSTKTFLSIVDRNLLPNCPVTRADIIAAERIFGPDVGSLKGKTVRRTPAPVETDMLAIPESILSRYQKVTVSGDIMFVNKLPFFVTISRHIKFSTAEFLPNQKTVSLVGAIKRLHQIYAKRGFQLTILLMDGQFNKDNLDGEIAQLGITLNTVSADEHVPEIERHIRTIKERARSVINMLPFEGYPARMIIELIYYCGFWLNSFPANGGISDVLSPRSIILGTTIDYTQHCKLEYGTYVQTHEKHDNTMIPRTTGAIALRPTGNAQGGHYFYSLTSGKRINRNQWTELPMPADVVQRVDRLCRRPLGIPALEFADRAGVIADHDLAPDAAVYDANDADDDDDDDIDYDPDADNDDALIAGVDDDNDNDNAIEENLDIMDNINNLELALELEMDDGDVFDANDNDIEPIADAIVEQEEPEEPDAIEPVDEGMPLLLEAAGPLPMVENGDDINNDNEEEIDVNARMDAAYGPRTGRYDLRARKPRDYGHAHATLESTAMTQHSVRQGIKLFGEQGVDAVMKELVQLHERGVVEPKHIYELNGQEKQDALQYLMFLKQKRNGTIKGRGCADGRKQRKHTTKEEASSPTVAIESVMLSCVIDAKENRDVGTVDLPGAFMQADMEDTVHMKLEGKMAELMVRIDPKLYRQYVQVEKGREVLYVVLKKALYGTLKAALLFWKKLSSQLKKWGFVINPYDSCVANKIINGKQCTILWHVDDLKISHVDANVVTDVINLLESEFGKEAPLTKTRGKVHDYLGMTIDYSIPGKVKFTMVDYIKTMLDELPDDMSGTATTPAASHLFDVNESAEKLPAAIGNIYHHNAAKLLFLCKRARPDVQPATAFLCTRVKLPDVDDYKKLTRTMKYLRGTLHMPLILEANDMSLVKWSVDASFAVHPDMRSHTGGAMTLGKGTVYGMSTRQKINTKSSTEAELVGVNDVMPQVLWTRYFLEAQGYGVKESVIYQDNKSTILLAENGKASSGRRTRHINIRYFFVKDRIASGEVRIEHCPTKEMVADFFTKPLQGSQFVKLRDEIMNANPRCLDYSLEDCRSVLNVATTTDGQTKVSGNETEWITVESKKAARQAKRIVSRTRVVPRLGTITGTEKRSVNE
jgi:hypothetical protein